MLSCDVLCSLVLSRYLHFCMCLCVCLLDVGIFKNIYFENTLFKYINIIRLYYCLELVCADSGGGLRGISCGLYCHHLQGGMLVMGESSSRRSCRCGRSHHIWRHSRCMITYIQEDKGMEQKTQNDSRKYDFDYNLWLYLTTLQVQDKIHTTRQRHRTKDKKWL